jgi:hypothetical protein
MMEKSFLQNAQRDVSSLIFSAALATDVIGMKLERG